MGARSRRIAATVIILIAAGAVFVARNLPLATRGGAEKAESVSGFEVQEGCVLVADRGNDGDSFRVRFPSGEVRAIRLHFVDAPETGVRRYADGNSSAKRLKYQADYFGGLSQKETIEIGKRAQQWVSEVLGDAGRFTVYTRHEEVYDSGRIFALVQLEVGGSERWLHELLVEQGLARIYTIGTTLPDGTSRKAQTRRLHQLEKKAKAARKGAWERVRKS